MRSKGAVDAMRRSWKFLEIIEILEARALLFGLLDNTQTRLTATRLLMLSDNSAASRRRAKSYKLLTQVRKISAWPKHPIGCTIDTKRNE